jgi:SNF2 family DNA or RNA helicase
MVDHARARTAALWHCGMGVGKTAAAIHLAEETCARLVLVVCPLSVCSVWTHQVALHGDGSSDVIELGRGSVKDRALRLARAIASAKSNPARTLYVVVNYDSAWRPALAAPLLAARWDLLIADESHRGKSPMGRASRFLERLAPQCVRRIALTGTPMPHSPLDIFAQFRFLDSSIFGRSFVRFRNQYAIVDTRPGFPALRGWRNQDDLAQRMARITFSVGREVLTLPPAIHDTRDVTLDPATRRAYAQMDENLVAQVGSGVVTAENGLVRLLRLQQLTSGFCSVDADPMDALITGATSSVTRISTEKEDVLADLLEDLPDDEPIIVVCRFRPDLDSVHAAAARLKRGSLELSGRRKELAAWQQPGAAPILALQIQSGGVGIDLTRARYMAFYSLGFSLGDYEQVLARVHRPGQQRTVFYYHLVARETVDGVVYGALRAKARVIDAVISDMKQRAEARGTGG